MPKGKQNLNTIYISERLQECLRPIAGCALTTIIAPMGYGKTTAVNWYLARKVKAEQAVVVRISVYSDNLPIFWKGIQNGFAFSGFDFLAQYECPSDEASAGFLMDRIVHTLAGETPCYIFIDDFHLLTDGRITEFLCTLANRLPENVHLIVASRDRFLSGQAIVRLGGKLHRIQADELRLNHTELSTYAHQCGTDLSEPQVDAILHSSEGWFSAVYLNLCALVKNGELPDQQSDIYEMFTSAMIDPLPEDRREFLIVMGLADEFTLEMAKFITENAEAEQILSGLTEQNAFVSRLDNRAFRFHHMMKECAERAFSALDSQKQEQYRDRYGKWYEEHGLYLHALSAYWESRNFDAALSVILEDAGNLLASMKPSQVLEFLARCPVEILKKHPLTLLVLMRRMVTWGMVPKMMELKELLLTSIEEHPELSQEERGNLLGECDLIMSFLMYNDITKMSQFHRSASAQMTRPAISIQKSGSWTFGSPSVLWMFHREPGGLAEELQEMKECMPHYYRITDGHGQGAERIMSAEADYMQGRFVDAQIALENTYLHIAESGQINMILCCDFLALRLSLCMDLHLHYGTEERRKALMQQHNMMWLNLYDSACAFHYALAGQTEQIPALFREHRLSTVSFLTLGKPMMEMIENQVYLAQGAYAAVIGRSESLMGMSEQLHYALLTLHLQVQTAAAYEQLGKRPEARALIKLALKEAEPDQFYMPFVENYRYLADLLEGGDVSGKGAFLSRIQELGQQYEKRQREKKQTDAYPEQFSVLTEQERKIVGLMAEHLSNKEIAEKLFLSEGTVKQYINQIYSKLQINGDTRSKRKELLRKLTIG